MANPESQAVRRGMCDAARWWVVQERAAVKVIDGVLSRQRLLVTYNEVSCNLDQLRFWTAEKLSRLLVAINILLQNTLPIHFEVEGIPTTADRARDDSLQETVPSEQMQDDLWLKPIIMHHVRQLLIIQKHAQQAMGPHRPSMV